MMPTRYYTPSKFVVECESLFYGSGPGIILVGTVLIGARWVGPKLVSVQKKLIAYHLGRLQDRSAAVRLKAIQELALIGDPEALEALQTVYQTDADVDVRRAAQEAGRTLFRIKQQGNNPR